MTNQNTVRWKTRCQAQFARVVHRILATTYHLGGDSVYAVQRAAGTKEGRCIYACWHGDIWNLIEFLRGHGTGAIVSQHSDGEIIARVLKSYAFTLARGSSTRGGARALLDFTRMASEMKGDLVITVDGPRGPAREVKDGILYAASRSGLPIVPMGYWTSRFWKMNSWDSMAIGKPFAEVKMALGDEIAIPAELSIEELRQEYRQTVTEGLVQAAERAEMLGREPEATAS
ncbi:MAG: lysophospholipid acyltransferase family protein [Planctomycetota bacterium]|nr:lysophospholipid acyltransferase family protein [Planctomycetota bacterium]